MAETRDPHHIALGRAIRQLREEAKLTQEELAERAEVSTRDLEQIEGGGVDADWGTLRRLAHGMSTELADLFRLVERLEQNPP